ncbi:MAG: MerR family transcriptional regulator [Bdellovibrionota bacterium]
MTIGKLAELAQVGIETIRFYEREGLMPKPSRRASGYRDYDHTSSHQIRFIKRAQDLGFTLKEIRELLALKAKKLASCTAVRARSDLKIQEIEGKIRDLKRMKLALSKLSAACAKGCTTPECPIIDCFGNTGCCS